MKINRLTFKDIIKDFSLESSADRLAILGPSGCGKTSLLRVLAGLEDYEGEVEIDKVSVAFQEARLLPWLDIQENLQIILGKEDSKLWLELMGLYEDRYKLPSQLSGGMAQRVNLARALAFDRELLLLDEPFSAIDLGRKDQIKDLLRDRKFILVTHDARDALELSQELVLVDGPPLRLIKHYKDLQGVEMEIISLLQGLVGQKE